VIVSADGRHRCDWAAGAWLEPYHDTEWGVPVHDERTHFEFLVLEGAQAGLNWLNVLRRRDAYREAFCGFDPDVVAGFDEARIDALVADARLIRNRAKLTSAVTNARAFRSVQAEHGSFDAYIWGFVGGAPVVNHWQRLGDVPATSALSEELSADLRRRGFSFVGPTICYAHLQATGLVMDHLTSCFRWAELAG
jgi:DNA-3-methyladenine glycosylase I